ncbi:MAG: hypothetical protein K2K40_09475 [Paramuribaculum sp.]|nr:hypothetical protein [Paramuribaculum sp.]
MLRLFNKFIPIVVGVLTAAIFAACSDESVFDNASDTIIDPYGCTVNSPVECDFGIYTAVCHLLDEKIKGYYVLAADSIQRISTKELKPFASCPILIDKKYGHLLSEAKSSSDIIIKYWYYGVKSTTIDGKEYQLVELIDDNAIIPITRTNPDQLCGTPPVSDYPTPDKLSFRVNK